MEATDDSKVESTKQPETPVDSRLIRLLGNVRANIREGQRQKGKLTLQDCRLLTAAEKTLNKFLQRLAVLDAKEKEVAGEDSTGAGPPKEKSEQTEDSEKVYATEEVYAAYRILLATLEVIQSTGIFTIEGSAELLDWMEELAEGLDAVKDPAIRMRELKEKTKQSGKEKKGSKKK